MFKSVSDTLRCLWYSRTHETVPTSNGKRRRSSNETDHEDSDVEIVSIKRTKREDPDSSSGLLSFITVPMSKMSEWVRKKTVRQDHFFVRPIPSDSHWNKPWQNYEGQQTLQNAGDGVSITNGSFPHEQSLDSDRLSRRPLHNKRGGDENAFNGDIRTTEHQPCICNSSAVSSRRSSCSSRPGAKKQSTTDKCFRWKEKENYLKLLQQYTTVDLGYHSSKSALNHVSGASGHGVHSERKPGSFLPVPSASSHLTSNDISMKLDTLCLTPHLPVTPSRLVHSSLLPPDRPAYRPASSSSSASPDNFVIPRQPSRALRLSSTSHCSHRSQHLRSSSADAEQRNKSAPLSVPPSDADQSTGAEDIISIKTTPAPALNFKSSEFLDQEWLSNLNSKYALAEQERQQLIKETEIKKKLLEKRREGRLENLDRKLKQQMHLFDKEPGVIEERPLPEVPLEKPLPELTDAMKREVHAALARGPDNQVLVEGFRLKLTRGDIATLGGLNWLNDEVINFYMNMLTERGEQEGFAKAYAFNTFFYPKLIQGGHNAVKRWTRKMDIFSYDYLVIPVHLEVHWCLCVVFMKERRICYYDSMGGNNNHCLNAVREYLSAESIARRGVTLDMSEWRMEIVKDIPQQMNGSDCGMFTCMYAETLTRGEKITFTQNDMPYFRQRVVYEILTKKLL